MKPFLIVLAVAAIGFFAVLFSAVESAPSHGPIESREGGGR